MATLKALRTAFTKAIDSIDFSPEGLWHFCEVEIPSNTRADMFSFHKTMGEIIAAFDEDGGVVAARDMLFLIENGQVSGGHYVSGGSGRKSCGCFYGGIILSLHAREDNCTLDEFRYFSEIELGQDAQDFAKTLHDRFTVNGSRLTGLEMLLKLAARHSGQTQDTNDFLAFLYLAFEWYIAFRTRKPLPLLTPANTAI